MCSGFLKDKNYEYMNIKTGVILLTKNLGLLSIKSTRDCTSEWYLIVY